jgi:hypothetical protein
MILYTYITHQWEGVTALIQAQELYLLPQMLTRTSHVTIYF